MEDLLVLLKRHWGYDSFRPRQEQIIRSLLAGHDAAVVMPTGGGKSLCYQLPAVATGRTVVVVSPLIALMQDQVAQLDAMGIPSALLNSTQDSAGQHAVMRAAVQGAFRLLYLSPERLARQDTLDWLQTLPLSLFAIDEAHCISEWGHEFRPEYRQLSSLRQQFPPTPIAAFTASATQRVRHDILNQLQLRDPHKYIASFHRANLRYIVHQSEKGAHQRRLLAAVRAYAGESVIVYASTIGSVEKTVELLEAEGIAAVTYHGQMESAARRRNQERWMNDEVRVLVGTIAFGLGINKAAVRAVIHTSLPKSIEQYYQEAGRAGRDGLPADCILLWQPRDAGLLAYFNEQIVDYQEKQRAWERYRTVRQFAEGSVCRHWQICNHFGQVPKWQRCEMCDVCGNVPEWLKAAPEEERRMVVPARLSRSTDPATGEPADRELVDFFKGWRRRTAQAAAVPAYVVMSDATLEDLCRKKPSDLKGLLSVTGIGERKAELYGEEILRTFAAYQNGARAESAKRSGVSPRAELTIQLLGEGRTPAEIAEIRGVQVSTAINTVAELVENGSVEYRIEWVGEELHRQIEEAALRIGLGRLKPIFEALSGEVSYEQIRLVVGYMRNRAA